MFKKLVSNSKRGFTLTEIMVAVGIVVVLTSIAIASGSSAKKTARDNQRKTDIRLLQVKLEAYREQYNSYPLTLKGSSNSLVHPGTLTTNPPIISDSVFPKDPSSNATYPNYQYTPLMFTGGSCTNGSVGYRLGADLEKGVSATAAVPIKTELTQCSGYSFVFTSNKTYDVVSPDAFKQN